MYTYWDELVVRTVMWASEDEIPGPNSCSSPSLTVGMGFFSAFISILNPPLVYVAKELYFHVI
jgi:hypothetical protein